MEKPYSHPKFGHSRPHQPRGRYICPHHQVGGAVTQPYMTVDQSPHAGSEGPRMVTNVSLVYGARAANTLMILCYDRNGVLENAAFALHRDGAVIPCLPHLIEYLDLHLIVHAVGIVYAAPRPDCASLKSMMTMLRTMPRPQGVSAQEKRGSKDMGWTKPATQSPGCISTLDVKIMLFF